MKQYDEIRRSAADAARRICMNISTFSPALALLYVFALLWILMGMDVRSFRPIQRLVIVAVFLILALSNQLLRDLLGPAVYGKRILFCLHLPTFFLFLCIAKRGAGKTAFMILTAIVVIFVLMIVSGAVMTSSLAWDISDTFNGLMMFPNLIGVVALSPLVVKITRNYVARKIKNQDVAPVLSYDEAIQQETEQ